MLHEPFDNEVCLNRRESLNLRDGLWKVPELWHHVESALCQMWALLTAWEPVLRLLDLLFPRTWGFCAQEWPPLHGCQIGLPFVWSVMDGRGGDVTSECTHWSWYQEIITIIDVILDSYNTFTRLQNPSLIFTCHLGYGNWDDLSKLFPDKSPEECKRHYEKVYIEDAFSLLVKKHSFNLLLSNILLLNL